MHFHDAEEKTVTRENRIGLTMRQLLIIFFAALIFDAAMAQRVMSDRNRNGVRVVEMSGKTFDINMRSHKVSLIGIVEDGEKRYEIDVMTYVDIPDNSKMQLKLFDGDTITLEFAKMKEGYTMVVSPGGMIPVMPFANITAVYPVTPEQLAKISAAGIRRMEIEASYNSRGRSWKKDKLGVFLGKSLDKLEERLKK